MNPFRLTLATDDLFCNRVAEIDRLMQNMLSGIHTVVYAPRRYGKSSLARVVLTRLEDKMVGVYVDLFSITSTEDVADKPKFRISDSIRALFSIMFLNIIVLTESRITSSGLMRN